MELDQGNISAPIDMSKFSDLAEARDFVGHCLAGGYDEDGALLWWSRPRTALGGQTPQDSWESNPEAVIELALGVVGPTDQS